MAIRFCSECGTKIPDDSGFCPKCGEPADRPPFPGTDLRALKHALKAEYRAQKHAYRAARRAARQAAWWGEWAWSPELTLVNAVSGGLAVIMLGCLIFMAASDASPLVTWSSFWAYFLLGMGVLLVLRGFAALVISRMHFGIRGTMISGLVLAIIGAAGVSTFLTGWDRYLWAGAIILGGLLIILAGFATYFLGKRQVRDE